MILSQRDMVLFVRTQLVFRQVYSRQFLHLKICCRDLHLFVFSVNFNVREITFFAGTLHLYT